MVESIHGIACIDTVNKTCSHNHLGVLWNYYIHLKGVKVQGAYEVNDILQIPENEEASNIAETLYE